MTRAHEIHLRKQTQTNLEDTPSLLIKYWISYSVFLSSTEKKKNINQFSSNVYIWFRIFTKKVRREKSLFSLTCGLIEREILDS